MSLDQKIYETVDSIKALKTKREFMLSFASDPYGFINKWLISQSRDLKVRPESNVRTLSPAQNYSTNLSLKALEFCKMNMTSYLNTK